MASCCHRSLRLSLPEISSHSAPSCGFATHASSSVARICGTHLVLLKGDGFSQKGHLGSRFVWREEGSAVASRRQSAGLRVEAAKRVSTGRSYVLSSTLKIEEGNEEQVTSLCKQILEWALEKKKDKKSGIQGFECNVDAFEKNVIHFWERYDSYLNMNDIRASPEHTEFVINVRPFLSGPIGLAVYEYKDGQIGHMMNPIGPKGEGGLDDATGQSGSKQQSSVINQGLGDTGDREQWGLEKMLAKVIGKDKADNKDKSEKASSWSLKALFGGGKE